MLRRYGEFLPSAPDDINGTFPFLTVPPVAPFPEELHNQKMCAIVWCYTGPLEQAEATFAPIRAHFGPPALDWVGAMPFPVAPEHVRRDLSARLAVVLESRLHQHVVRGGDRAARRVCLAAADRTIDDVLHPIDGAASRVAEGRNALELPRCAPGPG